MHHMMQVAHSRLLLHNTCKNWNINTVHAAATGVGDGTPAKKH
jgi:hypothetical protein